MSQSKKSDIFKEPFFFSENQTDWTKFSVPLSHTPHTIPLCSRIPTTPVPMEHQPTKSPLVDDCFSGQTGLGAHISVLGTSG